MMKRCILLALCMAVMAVNAVLGANDKQPQKVQVYMFGFAASMTDSVCVITDLQPVEVYLLPNGFLADRSLYSLQLNNHLVSVAKMDENLTCAVFFDKKKPKAEKRLQKVTKRYRSNTNLVLRQLNRADFEFQPEEWVEMTEEKPVAEKKGKKAGKGKKVKK